MEKIFKVVDIYENVIAENLNLEEANKIIDDTREKDGENLELLDKWNNSRNRNGEIIK